MSRGKKKIKIRRSRSGTTAHIKGDQNGNDDAVMDACGRRIDGKTITSKVFSHHSHQDEEYICDHKKFDEKSVKRVSQLLSDLFATHFILALPLLFYEELQRIEIEVIRATVMDFIEEGLDPRQINSIAEDVDTESRIKTQTEKYLDKLCLIVTRISTEDTFDLVCDLSARHGRDLNKWGPPCACSFANCLGCLQTLTESVLQTQPIIPDMNKFRSDKYSAFSIKNILKRERAADIGTSSESSYNRFAETWQALDDLFWKVSGKIKPMQIPSIRAAIDKIKATNGVAIWYAVASRELKTWTSYGNKGKGKRDQIETTEEDILTAKNLMSIFKCSEITNSKEEDDSARASFAINGRKHLGTVCKEQGNAAFGRTCYIEAAEHYTRGIGYDAENAVIPLNRAQCSIKLERFEEAELDCSTSILIDVTNYKSWCRRARSRFSQGKLEEGKSDLEHALFLALNDEKTYKDRLQLCQGFLMEAVKEYDPSSITSKKWQLPSYPEIQDMHKHDQTSSSSNSKNSDSSNRTSSTTIPEVSIEDVYMQVLFTVAFSLIVRQKTGVRIRVPISLWKKPERISEKVRSIMI
ncbi:uncharacterized protein FA14DRAFT_154269 [Meira miltonrushii]|uniref:TPR-like protein n=1 Tax=Meira miltonrushii TaxID=1280837 RepID=A0A316VH55_9BASI|nr:uncharacterized protein FA14DRAFT_154269 [Meira miltonrushii]PWN34835.1 hypothetical protein FA14DRAFT_154269 [Meira miltonrushii]